MGRLRRYTRPVPKTGPSALLCLVAGSLLLSAPAFAELCTEAVCEYDFRVVTRLTMRYTANYMTFLENGVLYYHDWQNNGTLNQVPQEDIDDVLVIDGSTRTVMTVNGIVPGPAIEVYEGAEIVVNVFNALENEAVTMHWHGIWQHGTPWMDGSSMITQCGILPGDAFTYRFIAEPAGTHSWHAHHGMERPDGLFGALIVHKRPEVPEQRDDLCDVDNNLLIMSEWYHETSPELYWQRISGGFYLNGPESPPFAWTRSVDGRLAAEIPWKTGLINGLGRYRNDDGTLSQGNLTVFDNIVPGKTYCFRVIATMMEKNLMLSFDAHNMTVFASDGYDIVPFVTDSLVVHQGETFDIAVTATSANAAKNWFIRVRTTEVYSTDFAGIDHEGWAIFRYVGAPVADPTDESQPRDCIANGPCTVLNCPFKMYPPANNTQCVAIDAMRNLNASDVPPDFAGDQFEEHFLNFQFYPLGINRRRFVLPSSPLLTQYDDANPALCDDSCAYAPGGCNCTNILTVPFNHTVQLVLTNYGPEAFGMHPLHLHGHTFFVMKVAYPPVDPVTAKMTMGVDNPDITCVADTSCSAAGWTNGTRPPLNFDRPIRKDTVVIPPGGYAVIRFRSNNPGVWHMHCHMTHHLFQGLGMVINEAPEYQPLFPPPPGFPMCGNFTSTTSSYIEQSTAVWNKLNSGGSTRARSPHGRRSGSG